MITVDYMALEKQAAAALLLSDFGASAWDCRWHTLRDPWRYCRALGTPWLHRATFC